MGLLHCFKISNFISYQLLVHVCNLLGLLITSVSCTSLQFARVILHQASSMATSTLLRLNCWVLGDDSDHIFTVEIDRNKNVGGLKVAIKERVMPAYDDITAKSLEVWKVSIPVDEDTDLEVKANDLRICERQSLWALKGLHRIFTDLDPEELHVIIKGPPISECRRLFLFL